MLIDPSVCFLFAANMQLWLAPVWMIAFGVSLGALVLAILYGVVWLISKPAAAELPRIVQEGALMPITYVIMAMIGFAVVAFTTVPFSEVVRLNETIA